MQQKLERDIRSCKKIMMIGPILARVYTRIFFVYAPQLGIGLYQSDMISLAIMFELLHPFPNHQ